MSEFVSIMDLAPSPARGVIRIGADCLACGKPEAIMGAVGKGRPLETFRQGYFCQGHAQRVCSGLDGVPCYGTALVTKAFCKAHEEALIAAQESAPSRGADAWEDGLYMGREF